MSPLTSALGSVSINQLPSELPPSGMGGKMERERRQTGIPSALRSLLPVLSLPLVRFGSGSVGPVLPSSPDQPTSGLFNG